MTKAGFIRFEADKQSLGKQPAASSGPGFQDRHWDSSNKYHEHRTIRQLFRYSSRYAATSLVDQSIRYLRIALVRGSVQYLAGSSGCAVSFDRSGLIKTEYSNFRSTNLRSSGLTLFVLIPILYSPSSVGGD